MDPLKFEYCFYNDQTFIPGNDFDFKLLKNNCTIKIRSNNIKQARKILKANVIFYESWRKLSRKILIRNF